MTDRQRYLERLRDAGATSDADIDLAGTALVLAALDRPGQPIEPYQRHLATLAGDTASTARGAIGLKEQVGAIREVVFGLHGYAGDTETYDDLRNANLMSVIDRRRGLPVALGVLCMHAARSQDWDMVGINFPSHFLLRLQALGGSAIIDPFDAARELDEPALQGRLKALHGPEAKLDPSHCRAVGNRDILLRLQNNIRIRALRDGSTERASTVIEGMVLLAPEQAGLRLETAVLQARSGKLKTAIRGLEDFLDGAAEAERHGDAARLLRELKGKLN